MTVFRALAQGNATTVEEAIRYAANQFELHQLTFGHGTYTAIDEAAWLTLFALGISPIEAPDYSQCLDAGQIVRYNAVMQQRISERKPAAYITGRSWFAGHEILCDERALVPRSPLAEFINNDCFNLIDTQAATRVLDLCTGGACIAIACAYAMPQAQVDASDISTDALSLAEENVALHQLGARLDLINSALFDKIDASYDLIISNPPYVDAGDIASMGDEFRHEPMLGLASGHDGLDLTRRMLAQAGNYLNDSGLLVVEVGNSAEALENAYPNVPFLWLEFEGGGSGVFALTKDELITSATAISAGLS